MCSQLSDYNAAMVKVRKKCDFKVTRSTSTTYAEVVCGEVIESADQCGSEARFCYGEGQKYSDFKVNHSTATQNLLRSSMLEINSRIQAKGELRVAKQGINTKRWRCKIDNTVEACAGYDKVEFFNDFSGVFAWKFYNILRKNVTD